MPFKQTGFLESIGYEFYIDQLQSLARNTRVL